MAIALSLDGRHALVCGASAGIGRATALALAGAGASVTALARTREKLEALVDELTAAGAPQARYVIADLDDRSGLAGLIDGVIGQHGPIHVVINNSGGPAPGPLLEASTDELASAFGRHVLAAHIIIGRVLEGMKKAGYGRFVNVISTSVREPIPGLGVSNTVRGAMASWAKTISRELPPGITINNILPGYTATERLGQIGEAVAKRTERTVDDVRAEWLTKIPEGRLAEPSETAGVIAFLASPAAAYIRGQSIAVDGGRMQSI